MWTVNLFWSSFSVALKKTHTEHIVYNTLEDIKNKKIKVINRDVLSAHY